MRVPKKFEFMALSARGWLDELYSDANRAPAGHQLRSDFAIALRWLRLKNFSDIKQHHYELWSAGFVYYLAEGKAPSASLKDQFKAFSKWAKEDPPTPVALDDAIRGVFGRLLSFDASIALPSHPRIGFGSSLLVWCIAILALVVFGWLRSR